MVPIFIHEVHVSGKFFLLEDIIFYNYYIHPINHPGRYFFAKGECLYGTQFLPKLILYLDLDYN